MASQGGEIGDTNQVLVEYHGCTRMVILNRPRQLNALSSEMVSKLLKFFVAYEDDDKVKLLIMKVVKTRICSLYFIPSFHESRCRGKGRAFCAGGDVSAVAHSISEGHWSYGAKFFWNEFILNYIIATYRKPQVSILNGIVMGGGAGVSIHGRFRVATENSVFAMPETSLGLFPDIGASYFLSRLPGYFGEYVGLTGVRLDGADMLACGLATHFVPSAKLSILEESLVNKAVSDPEAISAIINEFSQQAPLKETSAYNRLDIIDRCFSKRTVEDIICALEQEAMRRTDEWLKAAIHSLKKASPSSLKISLRSIRQGRFQGIDHCLIREYRMVCHVLRRDISKDFFEGCRAILVDKDKNPKWEPSKLELISEEMVDRCFAKVDDPEWEDLKLPSRQIMMVLGMSKL